MAPTKRIALVLANSEYKNNSIDFPIIECPKYDYESILKSLNILGFESSNIIGGLNLTSGKMREKIEAFNKLIIENPNCTSFVYYTGHGFEYKNGNYLAPIDVEPRKKKHREQKIIDNSIELSEITNILGNNGGLNLILLDACRIKKFNALSLGKYFVINNLPKETLVYFATSSGSEAWGCNESLKSSKFTSAFLKQMQIKGQEFGDIVKATNEEVKEQNPELRGNTTKSFYFNQ